MARRLPLVVALAVLLALAASGPAPRARAQAAAASSAAYPALDALVLGSGDLPGYTLDPARSTLQERPDGTVSYDAVYTRDSGASGGPAEIRLAAARTPSGVVSAQALAATRDALLAAGWTTRAVPVLGDEALGFETSGAPAGGDGRAGYGYVFRFGRHLLAAMVTGPSATTSFDQALGYAVQMSARLDAALARQPVPDPAPAPADTSLAAVPPAGEPPATTADGAADADPAQGRPVASGEPATPATGAPVSGRPAVSAPTVVVDVRLEDAPELANGFSLGGFSGLVAPDRTGTAFMTLTDRGPNGEIKVGGKRRMVFPLPTYTPRLVRLRLDDGRLRVVETTTLKLPAGQTDPVTRSRELSGLPAFDGAGEDAFSPDGKEAYGTDPNGVDTEGLALDSRDGSFWLADEYGPSILHVAADGTVLLRAVPRGLELANAGMTVRQLLPAELRRRKPNRGFEGIAIAPDGSRVFAMLQSPLLNPDAKSGESSRHVRIVVLDTSDPNDPKLAGVYVYQTEAAAEVGAAEQDDIKIGDIAAVSRTRILVGERDSEEGGPHKKVYLVDLAGATDVSARSEVNGRTIEQASEVELRRAGIEYARKSLVVDLAKLGFSPDKFEGLALIDPTTIAVVNDNDFGVAAIDSRGRVVRSGAAPRLVVIRVPDPLQ